MVMSEHELAARDAQRDIGAELLEAVRQVKAGQVGRVYQVSWPLIDRVDFAHPAVLSVPATPPRM